MDKAGIDTPDLIPEIETPAHLKKKQERMLAEAPPYLGLGFRKSRLDPAIYNRLAGHFQESVAHFYAEHDVEEINNLEPGIISSLVFVDHELNDWLAQELKPYHEAWAGTQLEVSQVYGIRCYQRGTFLYNHLDRPTHIVSATICVDHSLNSPWPLHIESIDGDVHQINLEPGEFVFYEGTRLAHGRPYPLDGEFYAGIFVHYHPAS